jgi:hypothetical protein
VEVDPPGGEDVEELLAENPPEGGNEEQLGLEALHLIDDGLIQSGGLEQGQAEGE